MEEKSRTSDEARREPNAPVLPTVNPAAQTITQPHAKSWTSSIPAAVFVIAWITLSSSVILFNKWILGTLKFKYPILLTTYHLTFATVVTQFLARWTTALDGRKSVKMTGRVFMRAIMPIGVFFSLSLICGNLTYLFLSVSFIQMLKATTPVAVLLASWGIRLSEPNLRVFINVMVIVLGVVLASLGEIQFVLAGFLYQLGGIVFEAMRLVMVQRLLSSAEYKMDPLVSLYYFAPICALMNFTVACFWELPKITMAEVYGVGLGTFFLNGLCAFLLNVSVVFLIGKTSVVVLTLSGVLKDILLVAASMIIWGDPVTGLQFFGYGIALSGLVYYKLGYNQIRAHVADGNRKWAELGAKRPILRKLVVLAGAVTFVFLALGVLAPRYAPAEYSEYKEYLNTAAEKAAGKVRFPGSI